MTLDEMIETGLSLVQDDPCHDLRVGFRCQLLSFIDDIAPIPHGVPHWRRLKLMRLAVEKVLGMWESLLPSDRSPHKALDVVDKLLARALPATIAEKEMGKLWTHCDDLAFTHNENQFVIMVGYGAAQLIREALSERHFGCEQMNEAVTDLDIDPHDHDSAFCAATAYSFGAPWESRSNLQRRLEFWTWWLTSAVDMALSE